VWSVGWWVDIRTNCLGQGTKIVISHIADDFRQAFAPRMYTATGTAIVTLIQIRIRIEIQIHIQMAAGGGGITKLSSHRLQMTMGFTKANCPQCTEVK